MSKSTSKSKSAGKKTAVAKSEKPATKKVKQAQTPEESMKQLAERYPDRKFVPGSYRRHADKNKYSVEIFCASGNGQKRRVFTSDIFQVRYCVEVQKKMASDKRKAARNAAKEALRKATPTA